MRNEIIFDDRGIPDILVVYTPDELGLPATLKGKAVKEYAISKYPNTMIGGRPYSLPYQQPAVNINHDEAIRLCESKGPGWHLITNDEWAALAHQSRKKGTLPRGNTDRGKSHSHPEETGVTFKDASGSCKTLTGSGPVTWNHDGTAEGVADMCGNIWEHVGGIRFVDGQVQVIPDNGAAAGADQSKDSPEWAPIYTADGDPVYYNVEGGHIKLQTVEPEEKDWDGEQFTELDASLIDIPEKLIELGLYPAPGYESDEHFYLDTNGERIVIRGGGWGNGADAGVFYFSGTNSRALVDWRVGFRSAFVRYSGDSGSLDNLDEETPEQQDKTGDDYMTLPGLMRVILAGQLAKLCRYDTAEGIHDMTAKVLDADETELKEATALLGIMAQTSAAVEIYEAAAKQAQLAMTTSITISKEVGGRE